MSPEVRNLMTGQRLIEKALGLDKLPTPKADPNDAFDRCPHCAAQYFKGDDVSTAAHFTGCPLKRV